MSGKAIRETLGFLAVVASMVFVGMEIRQNTTALRRDAALQRADALSAPFLSGDSQLPSILAKIKTVDGLDPTTAAFMDSYELSFEEAEVWSRYLSILWENLEADFVSGGESIALENRIGLLVNSPDNQLFLDSGAEVLFSDTDFVRFVERLRSGS